MRDADTQQAPSSPRHHLFVRVTHWITALAFFALLLTGVEILISHPRFYWGETGNAGTPALFTIPIPSSRSLVPNGYPYILPDQNGWSRYLHFQAAWAAILAGLVYATAGVATSHFRRNLLPSAAAATWPALVDVIRKHLRIAPPDTDDATSYNLLQRLAYVSVVFVFFPLVILTGLAMSPAFNAAVPVVVDSFGGRQSARTLHLFVSGCLLLFLIVHLAMVCVSGFRARVRAMITGVAEERA